MSILIRGMEMPKDGEMLCVNIYLDGKVCINLDLKCKRIATAVSVPPHGDLIDRDALPWEKQSLMVADEDWALPCVLIEDAPTIIEAEEGET